VRAEKGRGPIFIVGGLWRPNKRCRKKGGEKEGIPRERKREDGVRSLNSIEKKKKKRRGRKREKMRRRKKLRP